MAESLHTDGVTCEIVAWWSDVGDRDDRHAGRVTMSEQMGPDVAVLEALDDESCRCILEALTDETLTAKEIADACDLPLSSTYRKIDCLVEAGMLDESTRVRLHEKHVKEYRTAVDRVVVTIGEDGVRTFVGERSSEPGSAPPGPVRQERVRPEVDAESAGASGLETISIPEEDRVVVITREDVEGRDEQPVTD